MAHQGLAQTLELIFLKMPAQRASIMLNIIEYREKVEWERINEFIPSHQICSHNFKQNPFSHSPITYYSLIDICPGRSVWVCG
jgi:hypothetical protein